MTNDAQIPVLATSDELGRCNECEREWPECLCYRPSALERSTIVWIDALYPTIQPIPQQAAVPRCPTCGFFGCICPGKEAPSTQP